MPARKAVCWPLTFFRTFYIFQNRLKTSLSSQLGSNFDLNDDNAIEQNLLKMDIFYKEFNFEDITEVPGYTVRMLVCMLMFHLREMSLRSVPAWPWWYIGPVVVCVLDDNSVSSYRIACVHLKHNSCYINPDVCGRRHTHLCGVTRGQPPANDALVCMAMVWFVSDLSEICWRWNIRFCSSEHSSLTARCWLAKVFDVRRRFFDAPHICSGF